MPKVSKSAQEESTNHLEEMVKQAVPGLLPFPVLICGVNRKINTGNFENIDVYAGLAVPVMAFPDGEDPEKFKDAVAAAAELGFSLASSETGERYKMIKDLQSGGRK